MELSPCARRRVLLGINTVFISQSPEWITATCQGVPSRITAPTHISVVAQIGVCAALLAADEVLEFHRVAHEEHRCVADDVVVALTGVKFQREPSRVAPRVGAAALTGDG